MAYAFLICIFVLAIIGSDVEAQTCSDVIGLANCNSAYASAVLGQSDTSVICSAYNTLVSCATAINCQSSISIFNPCSSGSDVEAQTCSDVIGLANCNSAYASAVLGQSDTSVICSAYNTLVSCATAINCQSSIPIFNPCSSGTMVIGNLVLMAGMLFLQFIKRT